MVDGYLDNNISNIQRVGHGVQVSTKSPTNSVLKVLNSLDDTPRDIQ